jgi:hypothetical protein
MLYLFSCIPFFIFFYLDTFLLPTRFVCSCETWVSWSHRFLSFLMHCLQVNLWWTAATRGIRNAMRVLATLWATHNMETLYTWSLQTLVNNMRAGTCVILWNLWGSSLIMSFRAIWLFINKVTISYNVMYLYFKELFDWQVCGKSFEKFGETRVYLFPPLFMVSHKIIWNLPMTLE